MRIFVPVQTKHFTNYLSRIEFWIILYCLIRLIGITNPPLEIGHNWRQVTVLMPARNFYAGETTLLYPKLDFAGEKSGITGMEFPLLNYAIYGMAELFGWQDWYGRLINLIVSSIGIFFFFKIIKRLFNKKLAFFAAFIALNSVWFEFSRKTMPDTFSISLVMIGVYCGIRFLDFKKWYDWLGFVVFACLGILSKIPACLWLATLLLPCWQYRHQYKRWIWLLPACLLIATPVVWWYFFWVPYLVETYGFWHFFMGKNLTAGFQQLLIDPPLVAYRFYYSALKISGFILFLTGLFFVFRNKQKQLLALFGILSALFFIYMLKSGYTFTKHNYYIIPFAPAMAFIAAYPLTLIRKKWIVVTVLAIIAIDGIANQQHEFFIKDSERYKLKLEEIANQTTEKNDLIAINGGSNPQLIYFAHRDGWTCTNQQLENPKFRQKLIANGCDFIFINKQYGHLQFEYPTVYNGNYFVVYALPSTNSE